MGELTNWSTGFEWKANFNPITIWWTECTSKAWKKNTIKCRWASNLESVKHDFLLSCQHTEIQLAKHNTRESYLSDNRQSQAFDNIRWGRTGKQGKSGVWRGRREVAGSNYFAQSGLSSIFLSIFLFQRLCFHGTFRLRGPFGPLAEICTIVPSCCLTVVIRQCYIFCPQYTVAIKLKKVKHVLFPYNYCPFSPDIFYLFVSRDSNRLNRGFNKNHSIN